MKNWYLIVTDVSEDLESNAKYSRFGGILSMWGIRMYAIWNLTSCVFFHKVWDIGTKYVTYWCQCFTCCEELVQILTMLILRSVKFAVQQCSPQMCPCSDCIDSWSLPSSLLVNLYKLKHHKILTMICPAEEESLNQHCYLTINYVCLWKNLEKKCLISITLFW